ncbi:Tetratricopeptide-like helical domain superfamily [Sesbania bispinosa]|nr:Tetratricopeptide-like helical domain superfamily [Sesbania bispinosa]
MNERRLFFAGVLNKCSKHRLLDQGKQLHGVVEKLGFGCDLVLNNDLIDMYAKCGNLDLACVVFDRMPQRNVVSWTALMCGYLQNGDAKTSLLLFSKMGGSDVKPNEFTLSTSLKASGILGIPENGMQIHGVCAKSNFEWVPVMGNSLIDMYNKCGRVKEAARVFNTMPVRNLDQGSKSIGSGKQIHAALIRQGFPYLAQSVVAGALVDLYVKCRHIAEARTVFNRIEQKNVTSWSTLILGYAQEDNLPEAMNLFHQAREANACLYHQSPIWF